MAIDTNIDTYKSSSVKSSWQWTSGETPPKGWRTDKLLAWQGRYGKEIRSRVGLIEFNTFTKPESPIKEISLICVSAGAGLGNGNDKTVELYEYISSGATPHDTRGELLGEFISDKLGWTGTTTIKINESPELFKKLKKYLEAGNNTLIIYSTLDDKSNTPAFDKYYANFLALSSAELKITYATSSKLNFNIPENWTIHCETWGKDYTINSSTSVDAYAGYDVTVSAQAAIGYEITGMTVTDNGGTDVTVNVSEDGVYTFTMPEGGANVTFDKTPIKYTIRFASDENETYVYTQECYYGESYFLSHLTATANFSKTGYEISGWKYDDSIEVEYSPGAKISNLVSESDGNITLYAVWEGIIYYVEYRDGDALLDTSTHRYGRSSNLSSKEYSKVGYTFIGWNTSPDGSGKSYDKGQEVVNLTATDDEVLTLYAQWEPIKYTLTVETYGGNYITTKIKFGEQYYLGNIIENVDSDQNINIEIYYNEETLIRQLTIPRKADVTPNGYSIDGGEVTGSTTYTHNTASDVELKVMYNTVYKVTPYTPPSDFVFQDKILAGYYIDDGDYLHTIGTSIDIETNTNILILYVALSDTTSGGSTVPVTQTYMYADGNCKPAYVYVYSKLAKKWLRGKLYVYHNNQWRTNENNTSEE